MKFDESEQSLTNISRMLEQHSIFEENQRIMQPIDVNLFSIRGRRPSRLHGP